MAVIINASTSAGLQLSSDTSGVIAFQDDGVTNATIDTSGNVLIGRTTSTVGNAVKLDIVGGVNAASYLVNGTALPTAATQADQETGTSTTTYVTPSVQYFSKSAAKVWGNFLANSTTINQAYNVSSVADTGTGVMTVNFSITFSAATYAILVGVEYSSTTLAYSATYDGQTTTSVVIYSVVEAGSGNDPTTWSIAIFGDI